MLQFGPRMGARLFFGTLCNSRGYGELTFQVPQADPTNLQPLVALGENASDASISRRGHRLAYTSFSSHSSIWRIAAPGGSKTRDEKSAGSVNGDTPFIYSTRDDDAPEFSPDGMRIAFMANRSGNWEIWVCDSDGSNPVQLTSFRGAFVTTRAGHPTADELLLTLMQKDDNSTFG